MTRTIVPTIAFIAASAALLTACTERARDSSETTTRGDYLAACAADTDCDDQWSCQCGVCTVPCTDDSACGDTPLASVCGDEASDEICGGGTAVCLPSCQPAPRPAIGFCGDEQSTEPVFDDDGCLTGWICVDPVCDDEPMPVCDDGNEPSSTLDSAGCVHWSCPSSCRDVPEPPVDFCGDEESRVPVYNSAGCIIEWQCETQCPDQAPPQCGPNEEIEVTYDSAGCPWAECVPTGVCDDTPEPPVGFCGDEQSTEPVYDDAGCIVDWECVDAVCNDIEVPECADGQVVEIVEDSAGCFHAYCSDPHLPCGDEECSLTTEYCLETVPGVAGAETTYSCEPLPDSCVGTPSCSCLSDHLEPPAECRELTAGGLSVSIYLP